MTVDALDTFDARSGCLLTDAPDELADRGTCASDGGSGEAVPTAAPPTGSWPDGCTLSPSPSSSSSLMGV